MKDGKYYMKFKEGDKTHYFEVKKTKNDFTSENEYTFTPKNGTLHRDMVKRLMATNHPKGETYSNRAEQMAKSNQYSGLTPQRRALRLELDTQRNARKKQNQEEEARYKSSRIQNTSSNTLSTNLKPINFTSPNGQRLYEGNSFNTAYDSNGKKYTLNPYDQNYYPA